MKFIKEESENMKKHSESNVKILRNKQRWRLLKRRVKTWRLKKHWESNMKILRNKQVGFHSQSWIVLSCSFISTGVSVPWPAAFSPYLQLHLKDLWHAYFFILILGFLHQNSHSLEIKLYFLILFYYSDLNTTVVSYLIIQCNVNWPLLE